jgi:hypothetical protein
MGLFSDIVEKVKTFGEAKVEKQRSHTAGTAGGNTADDLLTDDNEIERLSDYIKDSEKKKILNTKTGLIHGVDKIGTFGDTNNVLKSLLQGAHKNSREYAAKRLARKYARENLTEKIVTKSGKEVLGKMLSKNVYLRTVSYERAGKVISYIQARSIKTCRVVSYHGAISLLGKLR